MDEKIKSVGWVIVSGLFTIHGWNLLFRTSETISKFAKLAKKIFIYDWEKLPKTSLLNSLEEHPEQHQQLIRKQKASGCMFMLMGVMGIISIVLMLIFDFS